MRKIKQMLAEKFSDQLYCGYWYSPEGEYVRFCLDKSQDNVEGKVTFNLFKGNVCSTIIFCSPLSSLALSVKYPYLSVIGRYF